jgi:hypothetical protein
MLTQYVAYPRAEIEVIPAGVQRLAARLGLHGFNTLLHIAQADRVVQWNSWLLSTNLHSAGLAQSVDAITGILRDEFPDHAILLKNVDPMGDPALIPNLERAGYDLMTSRQVFFFDGRTAEFWGKSTVKREVKEFAGDARYRWVEPEEFTPADAPRIVQLYHQLYLEKHSRLNPQYTARFVERALTERWLEFHGLRDAQGTIVGVFGFFTNDGVASVPFIGYDTRLPQEAGLYRRLFTGILKTIAERRQLLNYSSGAGDFKRRRGGIPVIEFNAVYSRHLSPVRQAAFRLAGKLLNHYARPWLEEHSH